jgi:hypothetical protein
MRAAPTAALPDRDVDARTGGRLFGADARIHEHQRTRREEIETDLGEIERV